MWLLTRKKLLVLYLQAIPGRFFRAATLVVAFSPALMGGSICLMGGSISYEFSLGMRRFEQVYFSAKSDGA
jgi:hypothetical protein